MLGVNVSSGRGTSTGLAVSSATSPRRRIATVAVCSSAPCSIRYVEPGPSFWLRPSFDFRCAGWHSAHIWSGRGVVGSCNPGIWLVRRPRFSPLGRWPGQGPSLAWPWRDGWRRLSDGVAGAFPRRFHIWSGRESPDWSSPCTCPFPWQFVFAPCGAAAGTPFVRVFGFWPVRIPSALRAFV